MNKVFQKILTLCFLSVILLVVVVNVEAEEDGNLRGYAWSDSIGWISFNYGTNIDYDGYISGYAWSDSIGWISFNVSDLNGCPSVPCSARFDRQTRDITGWAKNLESSTPWIKLGPIEIDGDENNYGLFYEYSSRDVLGYAWSDNIGWISFNCRNMLECGTSSYGVDHDPSIKADNLSIQMNYCMHDEEDYPKVNTGLVVGLNWEYFSTIDTQGGYQIQMSEDVNFVSDIYSINGQGSNDSIWLNLAGSGWNGEVLDWGTTYYWRIKVQGIEGGWSEWANSSFNVSQTHASPRVLFSSSPSYYIAGEETEFIAGKDGQDSETYNGSQPLYSWTFLGGNPSISNEYSETVIFDGDEDSTNVVLKVTDSAGYFCQKSRNSNVYNFTSPVWKEVSPF